MNSNPLISVIVPVYNTDKYLRKCVDSILSQTYKNIELFLVDDGSFDNCPAICDEYAARDGRVRTMHKENGGIGQARNVALDRATGEYIAFVDSDDYIEEDMLEVLVKCALEHDADLVISANYINTPFRIIPPNTVNALKILPDSASLMREYFTTDYVRGTVLNNLYKRELWNNIRFPEWRASEDNATSYKIFDLCGKSAIVPKAFYHYVQREDSNEHAIKIEDHFVSIEAAEDRYSFVCEKYPELENAANADRWIIRTAMYKRMFMTGKEKEYSETLDEWVKWFEQNAAPTDDMNKIRAEIIRHPYAYGKVFAAKIRLRGKIKKALLKLRR